MADFANKDEAEKCMEIGKSALRANDFSKAAKFFQKSLNLYKLPGAEGLLNRARENLNQKESKENEKQNKSENEKENLNNGTANGRPYTDEQEKLCQEVVARKNKGHYAVLLLEKNASEDEIKRSYRKLAVKCHPDKNGAPGAPDAFKAIGSAYATLSDSEKKAHYDRFGEDDVGQVGARAWGGGGQEFSPEDIFNMFFQQMNGGMRTRSGGGAFNVNHFHFGNNGFHTMRRNNFPQRERQQTKSMWGLVQMLPMLIMLLYSLFNFGGSGDNVFKFEQTPTHNVLQYTRKGKSVVEGIPFYTKSNFVREYNDRNSRNRVDKIVTDEYRALMQTNCRKGINRRAEELTRARRRKKGPERDKAIHEIHNSDPYECLLLFKTFGLAGGYSPRYASASEQEKQRHHVKAEDHGFG
mmetsp:Transcript_3067/g.4302  ORF Transcript_3067/g.4302 Transcript_3067/m.4302 type:complete len:411 (+) Transcript_3067:52-1284(+)|eukprot:CAMPEP_0171476016 /NCGR_PEP_ID=MMETSP0946-20130122/3342_1 /TAXON_ID=109269 /ORGANISM="Vaucheria litorea, Strain CCMP2940" /LENGTH=410 /DNA_ID=CAMNT_0012006203 /DNA_START=46 /DNA_END=1278 /DNA_ORIENTATION=-